MLKIIAFWTLNMASAGLVAYALASPGDDSALALLGGIGLGHVAFRAAMA